MQSISKAVITGASQGLGRALALELSARGASLALIARQRDALEEVAREARQRGGTAHVIPADMGSSGEVQSTLARVHAAIGPTQLLINNASTLGPVPMPTLMDLSVDALERVFAINLFGPFQLARGLLSAMLLGEGGCVVNISSDAAVEAYPQWGGYGSSKAALDQLTRVWAVELAGRGVRVLSIDPGEMNTAMHQAALPDADPSMLRDPRDVAQDVLRIVDGVAGAPSGSRLEAKKWEVVS